MLIDDLLEFCDASNQEQTVKCDTCGNPDSCRSCEQCLDDIHFRRVTRDYDCTNMAFCYVCKYAFKYSSEIEYLVRDIPELRNLPKFYIMSLGCGPSTDLFGFRNYIERNGLQKEMVYVGVDYNPIWKPVHQYLSSTQAVQVRYIYQDIFGVIRKLLISESTWRPNILVLQYVISDLVAKDRDMNLFSSQVTSEIVQRMPVGSFVVINDINLNTQARDYFEEFQRSLQRASIRMHVSRYHFENRNRNYWRYGDQHPENDVLISIPPKFYAKYHPWEFCSSGQMVIRKLS